MTWASGDKGKDITPEELAKQIVAKHCQSFEIRQRAAIRKAIAEAIYEYASNRE